MRYFADLLSSNKIFSMKQIEWEPWIRNDIIRCGSFPQTDDLFRNCVLRENRKKFQCQEEKKPDCDLQPEYFWLENWRLWASVDYAHVHTPLSFKQLIVRRKTVDHWERVKGPSWIRTTFGSSSSEIHGTKSRRTKGFSFFFPLQILW